jgi:hypothetical protein
VVQEISCKPFAGVNWWNISDIDHGFVTRLARPTRVSIGSPGAMVP